MPGTARRIAGLRAILAGQHGVEHCRSMGFGNATRPSFPAVYSPADKIVRSLQRFSCFGFRNSDFGIPALPSGVTFSELRLSSL